MKLRIQDNSLRFRLTRSEVDQLSETGSVAASACFPGGARLEYAVETSAMTGQPRANFSNNRLIVQVPQAATRRWASTEEVSITGSQPLEEGSLAILVEKDFACLTPREGEDEADMFPHPLKGQESC